MQRTSEDISVFCAHQHTMFYSNWTRRSKPAAIPTQSVSLMTNNDKESRLWIVSTQPPRKYAWQLQPQVKCASLYTFWISWNYQTPQETHDATSDHSSAMKPQKKRRDAISVPHTHTHTDFPLFCSLHNSLRVHLREDGLLWDSPAWVRFF